MTQIKYFPQKNGSKRKIPNTTIGEILERAAAVADPSWSIPCRLGLPRRPLSAGEDDIFLLLKTKRQKEKKTKRQKNKKTKRQKTKKKQTDNTQHSESFQANFN